MKMPWLAAILNFFFMGAGTLYNGRRVPLGAALTVGKYMFGAVFLNNTFLAMDGYQEAQAINGGRK